MNIYTDYVFPDKLISPVNGYECRRITKQNINKFGFSSVEDLVSNYPDFPLTCTDYRTAIGQDVRGLRAKGLKRMSDRIQKQNQERLLIEETNYNLNPKTCTKCDNLVPFRMRNSIFCSMTCSKRRNHSEETREKLRNYALANPKGFALANNLKKGYPLNKNPKVLLTLTCIICSIEFSNFRNKKTCSTECFKKLLSSKKSSSRVKRKDTPLYNYRLKCSFKFNVYHYPDEFNLSLIEEFGWYKAKNRGDNLNGIVRDHIISVRYGFDNNIDPKIIAHPANCQLMRHSDNVSKNITCGMTLEQLLLKIKHWDEKYSLVDPPEIESGPAKCKSAMPPTTPWTR